MASKIEDYGLIGNSYTCALVSRTGSIDWLCAPRFDSDACFAALVGYDEHGRWSLRPAVHIREARQRYRDDSLVLETELVCDGGVVRLIDFMPVGGRCDVIRIIEGVDGEVPVEMLLDVRFGYGAYAPLVEMTRDGTRFLAGPDALVLRGPLALTEQGQRVAAQIQVRKGDRLPLQLTWYPSHEQPPAPADAEQALASTDSFWREWAGRCAYQGPWRDAVVRSLLTLKALTFAPTGGIVAAPTSSLPEEIGGVRNWDYRYCWLRDAAMSARVLVDLGSLAESEAYLGWVDRCVERTGGHPERLHPLYTVDGYDLGAEAVIDTLPGYAGSRPVRIGNAANRQLQLDVFGPIADLIAGVAEVRGSVRDQEWRVIEAMVAAVERRWHEPDHGLWEARLPPRHHVYSKVMCWLTVDRAVQLVRQHGQGERPEWLELRDRIGANVLEHGWHEEAGAYTVAYGYPEMDASSLWIGLSGLLADDDPRFLATVLAIEAELRSGPIVYRYKWDDGLPGVEGGFHVCSAWMIEAYLRTGRRADAEELFDQMLDCAGPTGLLPEQYDPQAERGLGNHPQAYSHLGLIRCALLLDGGA